MKKVYIFGTGSTGKRIYEEISKEVNVIGFLDNDESKWGTKCNGITVLGNAKVLEENDEYDEVLICSLPALEIIREQLYKVGVPVYKINANYIETQVNARINFLFDFANIYAKDFDEKISVAEGGVFQGEFSKEINKAFPNNKIYLFDTFEGFDERDTSIEKSNKFSIENEKHLNITSVKLVCQKLPFPDKAIIRKGYFPDTAEGLENEKFGFVNLDFDLYNPILEGIRFFYPRLVTNGILLVHDYYNPGYLGVPQAVADYEDEINVKLLKLPIGDHISIAIIKK